MGQMDHSSENKAPGLRDEWAGDFEFLTVDCADAAAVAKYRPLLQQAYEGVFLPFFGTEEGGDKIEDWIDGDQSSLHYHIILAGHNLRSGDKPEVAGMLINAYFVQEDLGYLAYIITDPAHRRAGLGNQLFRIHENLIADTAAEHGKPLRGWFLECHDPAKQTEPDEIAYSRKLVATYLKWGGAQVPCDLKMPPEEGKTEKIDNSMLVAFPHPRLHTFPKAEAIEDFLACFYRRYGIAEPAQDADFQAMTADVRRQWQISDYPRPSNDQPRPSP